MIIKFKYNELSDLYDQDDLGFGDVEPEWIEDDDIMLRADGIRVVVPDLKVSFRVGELFVRNEEVEDPDDSEAWDFVHSVEILYEEDEKDAHNYLGYSTRAFWCGLEELQRKIPDDVEAIDCFIDTSELVY